MVVIRECIYCLILSDRARTSGFAMAQVAELTVLYS